jgi:hypothetical protein
LDVEPERGAVERSETEGFFGAHFPRKAEFEVSDILMSGESAASAATTHTFFFLFGKEEQGPHLQAGSPEPNFLWGEGKVRGEKRRKTSTAGTLFLRKSAPQEAVPYKQHTIRLSFALCVCSTVWR